MNHLDYMYSTLKDLKSKIDKLPFDKTDMRKAYFEYNWDILDNYYKQFCWIALTDLSNKGKIIFDTEGTKEFANHLDRVTETTRHEMLFYSARNNANRSFITDSWSNFEFSITYISENVLNDETKHSLFHEKSNAIKKILKNQPLTKEETTKIDKNLVVKRMPHVSINRKYEKLYSLINDYDGDKNEDKRFLAFFGSYRNCMHSNFIFHGNDFEYDFNGLVFYFRDGNPISHNKELHIRHFFDLILHLNEVFKRICFGLNWTEIIPCPLEN